jgi:hypothetical protein
MGIEWDNQYYDMAIKLRIRIIELNGPWSFSIAMLNYRRLPSGKRLHNYGKSPFFMGKLVNPLFLWLFSIANC